MPIAIISSGFEAGETIAERYTGDGEGLSPPLSIEAPEKAKELALICDDPDAPTPQPWVHWVIYNLPPDTRELPAGIAPVEKPVPPSGAVQGKNSWGGVGYRGPAPPRNGKLHHYRFRIYALDAALDLKPGLDKAALLKAIKGHIVAEGELVGTYSRKVNQ